MRTPTPEEEEALRARWRKIGTALVDMLIVVGAAMSGHAVPGSWPGSAGGSTSGEPRPKDEWGQR
ncbi:hypothetical protein [Amycolatopsis nigrescens]|uniref:hypothetical protein n=1 Tax=Amycolatopsis nigrescens TaxID=381445 RepID=UPI0003A20B45|nr:hypothetical protein [Amycolatopsis nigrescens]